MNSMSVRSFVDTNVLIYAHDPTAGAKHLRANELVRQLWETGTGVISTQVLQELCVNLRRRNRPPLPIEKVRFVVEAYLGWVIVVNGAPAVLQGLDIESRHNISFWDALILNAAEEAGCEVLYSEDLSAGQHYGSVLVINPFQ
jgi:predicted nucleic acid-binding protein